MNSSSPNISERDRSANKGNDGSYINNTSQNNNDNRFSYNIQSATNTSSD